MDGPKTPERRLRKGGEICNCRSKLTRVCVVLIQYARQPTCTITQPRTPINSMSNKEENGTHIVLGPTASKTVQTLVEVYGFDLERSVEAVQALGEENCSNVSLAVDWLLEHGEEDKGGAVQFCHCPHLDPPAAPSSSATSGNGKRKLVAEASAGSRQLIKPSQLAFGMPCARGCASTENWICLECGVTSCGRYVKKHALAHHEETGHTPSVSLADLSVWCYLCDGYVQHPTLSPLVQRLQNLKFGSDCGASSHGGPGAGGNEDGGSSSGNGSRA